MCFDYSKIKILNDLSNGFRRFPDRSCKSFETMIFIFRMHFVRDKLSKSSVLSFQSEILLKCKNQIQRFCVDDEWQLLVFPIISVFHRMVIVGFEKSYYRHLGIQFFVLKIMLYQIRDF